MVSRTSRGLKNSSVALIFYVLTILINFISRKVFLEKLGEDILGLNTTLVNILQFLNLAELGISTAVGFTLYEPIKNDDREQMSEIVSLQGKLYRRIAVGILGGAVIVMVFFPWIFKKITLPLWYTYASFITFLFGALIGYFFNYKQILLSASQQDFKIQYSFRSINLIKVVAQIIVLETVKNGYVWWLILEAGFSVIASLSLHFMTIRTFPWLKNSDKSFKELKLKYHGFTLKIKQLFLHKIGSFVLTQTSPLIIYSYSSLSLVTLYGNYMVLITGIQQLVLAVFNSMTAGIGNLVVEGNDENIWKVFKELFSVRIFIASILCFILFKTAPSFISLWIGKEYLLDQTTLILLLLVLFINISRYVVEAFINAYGLYHDILAPLIEAALNIGLSILLGYFYGLNGIILGVLISLLIIVVIWKPYFLFSRVMSKETQVYFKLYFKNIILIVMGLIISNITISILYNKAILSWGDLMFYIFNIGCVTLFFVGGLLVIFKCGLNDFLSRIFKLVTKK